MIFLKSGIQTSIQDLGRNGFRSLGINPNGVMDSFASRNINILLENNENEAVLEMHFPSPEILFEENTILAIGGADFSPMIDNQPIINGKVYLAKSGSTLKFIKKNTGERVYLSVKNGFKIEKWLDSASTNILGKFGGKKIDRGDKLELNQSFEEIYPSRFFIQTLKKSTQEIRLIRGNEFNFLSEPSKKNFDNQQFMISKEANRMAFRLESEPLFLTESKELLSSAVDFGTIQLLPNGQLVILMADHQTTGGYPRLGNIVSSDLSILAQKNVGDKIKLKIISVEEAENILLEEEKAILRLKSSISLRKK